MASIGLSICSTSKPLMAPPTSAATVTSSSSSSSVSPSCHVCRRTTVSMNCFSRSRVFPLTAGNMINRSRRQSHVVRMAPDEEKLTRRNPLDFPLEWERPKPGRRPDIFPQFSPMKTPIPPPLPYDPPEEDEEEEEKKKEEEEEDPDKEEETEKPDKDQ